MNMDQVSFCSRFVGVCDCQCDCASESECEMGPRLRVAIFSKYMAYLILCAFQTL
jgi:hypothetical protein